MPRRHALQVATIPLPPSSLEAGVDGEVLRINDLVKVLKISRNTILRLRSANNFPIPELESLDSRPRWSRVMVDRFLAGERLRRPQAWTPRSGNRRPRPTLVKNAAGRAR